VRDIVKDNVDSQWKLILIIEKYSTDEVLYPLGVDQGKCYFPLTTLESNP